MQSSRTALAQAPCQPAIMKRSENSATQMATPSEHLAGMLRNDAVAAWKQSHQRDEVCQRAPIHVFKNYGDLQSVPQASCLCI